MSIFMAPKAAVAVRIYGENLEGGCLTGTRCPGARG